MLNVVQPGSESIVAVIGAGVVGLSAIMALKMLDHRPRKIIAVDVVSSRLELARECGATHGVNSKLRPDLMKVLMDITEGHGVDGSIDTTGRPEVIEALMHSTARKGKVVTVGVGEVCIAAVEALSVSSYQVLTFTIAVSKSESHYVRNGPGGIDISGLQPRRLLPSRIHPPIARSEP